MSEILLVRHAKSTANVRNPAFGNEQAPLTDSGVDQAAGQLRDAFIVDHNIDPSTYEKSVLSSKFLRPQQTAYYAGFRTVDTDALINEGGIPPELLGGREVVRKHTEEGWIPEALQQRASRFIELVRKGELEYQIYFTHGLFIAAVLSEIRDPEIKFNAKRGYIPRLATITPVSY